MRLRCFVIVLLMIGGLGAVAAEPGPAITAGQFERLAKELHVKNQPWATAPWKRSVTEAREQAAREKKPIFLVVNTGNCLGWV